MYCSQSCICLCVDEEGEYDKHTDPNALQQPEELMSASMSDSSILSLYRGLFTQPHRKNKPRGI